MAILGNGNSEDHDDDDHSNSNNNNNNNNSIDIYPINCYFFGSVEAASPVRNETIADRVMRMRANYDAFGMRKSVAGVIVVELFKYPHLLLLQIQNSIYKLPGGRLRRGESDIDGLKRKLSNKLSAGEDGRGPEWEVGECLGIWWRPNFESLLFPYFPQNVQRPKESVKVFLVKLPPSRRFIVPRNSRLLAVPLCQLNEKAEIYGDIISGVPQLLSRFSFNILEP